MNIERKMKDTSKFARKDSLCWHCSRSTDGTCSWSADLVPVEGWTAKKSIRKSEIYKESYNVEDCPLFARYKTKELDDEGAVRLCDAVMAKAGRDYLEAMRHEKELRDRDPALFSKRAVYGVWDRRSKETVKYGKRVSDTWKTLYAYEPFNDRIIDLERFFRSEHAELFGENMNPVYIMEAIQREVGIRHDSR